jgi:hypothetical protein
VGVLLAVVFFAGVVLRVVVRAMGVLRPAGVLGSVGAPVLVVGDEECGGEADGEGDAVGPGHGLVSG